MTRQSVSSPVDDGDLLRSLPLLDGLAPSAADAVVGAARVRAFGAGAAVFSEGHPAQSFFVVLRGSVKLVQLTGDGEAIVFRLLGAGDVLGTASIVGTGSYPVSAFAVTAATTLHWSAEAMRRLLDEHPRLSLNVLRSVSERLQALRLQYRQLATEKAERRIARALLTLMERVGRRIDDGILLDVPLSREDVAQLTGTTVFTVSRIISQWEASGTLRAGRQQLVIRQPQMLASIADVSAGARRLGQPASATSRSRRPG